MEQLNKVIQYNKPLKKANKEKVQQNQEFFAKAKASTKKPGARAIKV